MYYILTSAMGHVLYLFNLWLYFSDDEISDNAEELIEKVGEYFVNAVVEGCCKLTKKD